MNYLVIFSTPAVKPDFVHFTMIIFADDVADPPIALVILGINEVRLVVSRPDRVVILGKRWHVVNLCYMRKNANYKIQNSPRLSSFPCKDAPWD